MDLILLGLPGAEKVTLNISPNIIIFHIFQLVISSAAIKQTLLV